MDNKNFFDLDKVEIEIPKMDFLEIDKIVENSIKEKLSFRQSFIKIFKDIGMKNIFHDKVELFILIFIGIVTISFSLFMILNNSNNDFTYSSIFLISPIFYLIISMFSFFNAKEKGALEIELTCKYNINALSAIRMFIFSILAALINTAVIVVISLFEKENFELKIIAISITSLFLFSAILIYFTSRFRKMYSKYLVIVGWIGINIIITIINTTKYNDFLFAIPIYIHTVITIICLIVYIKSLKKYMNLRGK